MNDRTILRTGIISTVIVAVCCFTPVLVILLAAVGLSALVGMLDYVLLPALAICVLILFYGLYLRQKPQASGKAAE